MKTINHIVSFLAVLLTIGSLMTWGLTGRHYYTKFQVVERVAVDIDPDDPLAATGFYDEGSTEQQVVSRDAFHFGLLPTPQGLFDRHMLSVATLALPLWAVWGAILVWNRLAARKQTN